MGLSLLGSPFFTYAQDSNGRDGKNLVGIDQFGRTFGTVGGFREDRAVGMFYWLWIGQANQKEVYDASKIVASQDGIDKLAFRDCPESPDHGAHYWGEPLWGYYNSSDEWVIRKQMQMLTLAGVDFIFFDHTITMFIIFMVPEFGISSSETWPKLSQVQENYLV